MVKFLKELVKLSSQKVFLADGMLGKLARWLRFMGYDVKYLRECSDEKLLRLAKAESRILLTKDSALHYSALKLNVESVLLNGGSLDEDLAILACKSLIDINIKFDQTRCPICNSKLNHCRAEDVIGKVPEKVLKSSSHFWICPNCGKVYWIGSHWKSIKKRLKNVVKLVESKCSGK